MKRVLLAIPILAVAVSAGCATKKFVRNEVGTSASALSSRIDTTSGEVKETRDAVDAVNTRVTGVDQKVAGVDSRVTTVDGKVTAVDGRVASVDSKVTNLDGRTTEGLNNLKSDVGAVNAKTDRAMGGVDSLDKKFENRNNLSVAMEHAVLFKFDSATLDPSTIAMLDEIAGSLTDNRDAIVVLEGHTDSTGDKDYNVQLGERRVDAVRRYLATEKSVPVYRIHQISFGAAKPVAPNNSREGRERNRSVTVTVLTPNESAANAQ